MKGVKKSLFLTFVDLGPYRPPPSAKPVQRRDYGFPGQIE
jgi:hypothetical protein